jgi:hypothetical protein
MHAVRAMKANEEGFGGHLRQIYMFLALKMHFPKSSCFQQLSRVFVFPAKN